MNTQEALRELFTEHTNRELSEITGENYYTVTSWKFKFKHNQLSMEKQIEILTKTTIIIFPKHGNRKCLFGRKK